MEENKYDHFVMITVADPPGTVGDTHDLYIPSWQHQEMFI